MPGNKVDLEGSIGFLLQRPCATPSPCWSVAEEWVWDTVHASVTHSQPVSLEAMIAAGSFRKAYLAPKEMGPFLPLEKSPERRHPGSCPAQEETHPWKRARQRESWSSKADPPICGAWKLPCLWTSIAGGGRGVVVIQHLVVEAGLNLALLLLVAEIIPTHSSYGEYPWLLCPKASKGCPRYLISWIMTDSQGQPGRLDTNAQRQVGEVGEHELQIQKELDSKS